MAQSRQENPLKSELEEIRKRLLSDPTRQELEAMQLQLEVLEKWAQLAEAMYHQHDHMDDHDHAIVSEPTIVLDTSALTSRAAQRRTRSREG